MGTVETEFSESVLDSKVLPSEMMSNVTQVRSRHVRVFIIRTVAALA